jgi:hypothetical protein
MGNRANIMLHYEGEGHICLYSHWDGSDLATMLQSALVRGKGRWGDNQYLGRIIFSEMIKDSVEEETGYGLSPNIHDGQWPVIDVFLTEQQVRIGNKQWNFPDYCDAETRDLLKAMRFPGVEEDEEDEEN